MDKQIKR